MLPSFVEESHSGQSAHFRSLTGTEFSEFKELEGQQQTTAQLKRRQILRVKDKGIRNGNLHGC